jgi:hypothetical protein
MPAANPRDLFRTPARRQRPTLADRIGDARYHLTYVIPGRACAPWATRTVAALANVARRLFGPRAGAAVVDWEWNRIDHFPTAANHRAAWEALAAACPWSQEAR